MSGAPSISFVVNGRDVTVDAPARRMAADVLRALGLHGVHLGCEHGVCGACTILLDGVSVRSCLLYAGQLDGRSVTTVEGVHGVDGELHPVQEAFCAEHALQCGFCTPALVLVVMELLGEGPAPADDGLRAALSGNICRCTGYEPILAAVRRADESWAR